MKEKGVVFGTTPFFFCFFIVKYIGLLPEPVFHIFFPDSRQILPPQDN